MKHKILTSLDAALKNLGDVSKDSHELSVDTETQHDDWNGIHDQTMAVLTMLIGIRSVASDALRRDYERNRDKR